MIPDAPWRVVIVSQIPIVAQGFVDFLRAIGHEPVAHVAARPRPEFAHLPQTREWAAGLLVEGPQDIDLVYPASRDRLAEVFRLFDPDLVLCTAFPWRMPTEAIAVPRIGCVNGHPSVLPRYRGPTPVAWAIRNGETEIGLTYHRMDEQFDTGPILAQGAVPIDDEDTIETFFPKLRPLAAELLPVVFERLARGERGESQEGGDYQSLFEDDYAFVDPAQTAREVHTQVRAWSFAPFSKGERGPILVRHGERVRLLKTSLAEVEGAERLDCADAPLWIVEAEPVDPVESEPGD